MPRSSPSARTSDTAEHVALLIGAPNGRPPLVRLHSECLTGDVLGSLKCDCGPQLDGALAAIAESGWGILLYLRQEGRGIGLVNKLRAYALQDQGFDTVDANLRLGFADDERDFAVAARMLDALAQPEVRLLTNNPEKVAGLEAAGIEVVEQVPLKIDANRAQPRLSRHQARRAAGTSSSSACPAELGRHFGEVCATTLCAPSACSRSAWPGAQWRPGAQADHGRARRHRAGHADRRILDDHGALDVDAQRLGGVQIEIGRGLAARDMLAAAEDHRRRNARAGRDGRDASRSIRSTLDDATARGRSGGRLSTKAIAPATASSPSSSTRRSSSARACVEVVGQRRADPAFDRVEERLAGQAHEIGDRLLDAGRMADRGQIVGDLGVAGIFAFEQHAVEIEDDGVELHARSPNSAVPTRTWVAPIMHRASRSRPTCPC